MEIHTVFVHSNTHNQRAWKNLNQMILQGMVDNAAPHYTIKAEHITCQEFLDTSEKSEARLIVFISDCFDIEGKNPSVISVMRQKLTHFYSTCEMFAMPGTELQFARKLGIFYEEKAPKNDLPNNYYLKKLIDGEYSH